jgi:hypothetical protein
MKQLMASKAWPAAAALLVLVWLCAPAGMPDSGAQQALEASPSAALTAALVAACREDDAAFAPYLTADNAAAFRELPLSRRRAFLQRLVLLSEPGRPLLSSDAQARTVLRCETRSITGEIRFGQERIRENLGFVPVEFTGGRRTEFGMVRESGEWKILSLGLLLIDIPELARQWEESELAAKEGAAIAALRKLAEAIGTYRQAFGALPEKLEQLGPAPKEGISPEAAQLVDAELAAGTKGGYRFRYRIVPAEGRDTTPGFELAATPIEYPKTGRRSFFLDANGKLRGGDKQGAVAISTDPFIEPRS